MLLCQHNCNKPRFTDVNNTKGSHLKTIIRPDPTLSTHLNTDMHTPDTRPGRRRTGGMIGNATAWLAVALMLVLASCGTPKNITYLQGFDNGDSQAVRVPERLTMQPDDRLAIVISSSEPALAEVFNKAIATYRIGTGTTGTTTESKVASFTVDPDGNINFPMIGKIHVAGLTRYQVAEKIEKEITDRQLLKDPVATVEFQNATFAVLGDVHSPGTKAIARDNLTLLQAIALAGDLSITGDRTNILVVREENGQDMAYRVDLTDTKALMESPVFYIQQNDVIYVEPNNMRKRQSTEIGNVFYSPNLWISLASVISSLALIIWGK